MEWALYASVAFFVGSPRVKSCGIIVVKCYFLDTSSWALIQTNVSLRKLSVRVKDSNTSELINTANLSIAARHEWHQNLFLKCRLSLPTKSRNHNNFEPINKLTFTQIPIVIASIGSKSIMKLPNAKRPSTVCRLLSNPREEIHLPNLLTRIYITNNSLHHHSSTCSLLIVIQVLIAQGCQKIELFEFTNSFCGRSESL